MGGGGLKWQQGGQGFEQRILEERRGKETQGGGGGGEEETDNKGKLIIERQPSRKSP